MPDFNGIKYVVLDVDGTLTDGGIYYDSMGNEIKRFDVKDGLGIKVGIAAGLEFLVITGRVSPMVDRRVKELGIQHILSGIQMKYPVLVGWMEKKGVLSEELCYIGDDWNDLQCMESVGIKMCPADAAEEIIKICDYVAKSSGGHGAVRECLEYLLKRRGNWALSCKDTYYS